ncbi:MAG TPA: 2Fe-2S iron-sulfur cluster-binding protein, partial [Xanthobacteraceae bacterium]|nr:2Fe-2S iron-sulfur cluster-binding protein [Xanthobacteraceae bacterium]
MSTTRSQHSGADPAPPAPGPVLDGVRFTLDGAEVLAHPGETIWQVAKRQGIDIAHLCYSPEPGYRPDGNCRACMVEIDGERVLAASCIRKPSAGMTVKTATARAVNARRLVLELLMADQGERHQGPDPASRFWAQADAISVTKSRFSPRPTQPAPDRSHPAMAVNLDVCIQCNLCVRACREVQVNDVIGMAGRGGHEKIVFDFDDPMGASTCVACGECVQACPTGALMPTTLVDATNVRAAFEDRAVDSVCPYCGVGCQLTYHVKDDKLLFVSGRDGPSNHNRLCVKGRFGFDYIHHPHRLLAPLVRKHGVGKRADDLV